MAGERERQVVEHKFLPRHPLRGSVLSPMGQLHDVIWLALASMLFSEHFLQGGGGTFHDLPGEE